MRFNSIVVRLKGSEPDARKYGVAWFQFHSGSIKSEHDVNALKSQVLFQFHSGSIKRRM